MRLLSWAEQNEHASGEQGGGHASEQDDGAAVGLLRLRRRGRRIVPALRAALSLARTVKRQCHRKDEEPAGAHWKKASRPKRKSQKTPMECQYQAAQSTKTWRFSICREV